MPIQSDHKWTGVIKKMSILCMLIQIYLLLPYSMCVLYNIKDNFVGKVS